MTWIAPTEKDTDTGVLEKRLWDAASLMAELILALQRQIQILRRSRYLLLSRKGNLKEN